MSSSVDPQMRRWLVKVTQIHSGLCHAVRLLGQPEKAGERAGGEGIHGDLYAQRIIAGDPSLLYDFLSVAADGIDELRRDVEAVMESTEPTSHQPGSKGKVGVMVERAAAGKSLFNQRDVGIDVS